MVGKIAGMQATATDEEDLGYGDAPLPFGDTNKTPGYYGHYGNCSRCAASVAATFEYIPVLMELVVTIAICNGRELDSYMQDLKIRKNVDHVSARPDEFFDTDSHQPQPDSSLLANHVHLSGSWTYIAGKESASTPTLDLLLKSVSGFPSVRWKNIDLMESRLGYEFLPKCYMCQVRTFSCHSRCNTLINNLSNL